MEKAKEYLSQGALWNGGVFAFKIGYLLNKTKELCGTSVYKELFNKYDQLEKISFDYAIAEKEPNIKVIKYSGEWKDLGTWNTFTEAMTEPTGGNVVLGENCENVHVVNELSIPVVALGLKNTVVAISPDGILVSEKSSSSYLKKYVPNNRPMFEKKEWGEYKVLDYQKHEDGNECLIKEIVVQPNKNISYQSHEHRHETWTVIKGEGLLLINDIIKNIKTGDSVSIAKKDKYSVKALEELHIIEVQFGDNLTDGDVERYDWKWE